MKMLLLIIGGVFFWAGVSLHISRMLGADIDGVDAWGLLIFGFLLVQASD